MDNKPLFDKKALVALILPLLGEQFLSISLGLFDSIMVASCGEAVVSGVSLVDTISVLVIQLLSALATGGAVICSQYLGQGHRKHAKKAAGQLMLILLFFGTVIMTVILFTYRPMLSLIYGRIEGDVMESAVIYFMISAISYPFLGLYNAAAALFRSQGNSRVSLFTSLVMNVVNIGGNAFFIFVLHMGAAGAATATLISRVMAALSVFYMLQRKNPMLALTFETVFSVDWLMIRKILYIGLLSGIENASFHIGKLLLASMISGFGTAAITANAVSNNIAAVFNVPGVAIGLAILTVIGQSIGKGDEKETLRYGRILHRLGLVSVFISQVVLLLTCRLLLSFYQLSDATFAEAYKILISFAIAAMVFWAESFTTPNILRAAGAVGFTSIISMISMWTFRIGSAVLLALYFNMGVFGVWIAMYIDWAFRGIVFFIVYARGRWAKRKPIA